MTKSTEINVMGTKIKEEGDREFWGEGGGSVLTKVD